MNWVTNVLLAFALLVFSPSSARCQRQPSATKEAFTVDERKQAAQIEDTIAAQFEDFLKDSGVRKLSRANTNAKYRQMLCSASVNGLNPAALRQQLSMYHYQQSSNVPGPS